MPEELLYYIYAAIEYLVDRGEFEYDYDRLELEDPVRYTTPHRLPKPSFTVVLDGQRIEVSARKVP